MRKLLLLLVIVIGVAVAVPEARDRLVDRSRPLLNPAYRWMTVQQLNQMVMDLEFHQETRGPLPTGRGEFDQWMNRRYPQERTRRDAWGTRYQLEVTADGFRVRSAGADGVFGTDDDVWREGERLVGRRR
jgi:hypothetical protein